MLNKALRFAVILFITSLSGVAWAQSPASATEAQSTRYPSIAYQDNDNPRQVLDLYLPAESSALHPVLFIVHGGGFVFGDQRSVANAAAYFADQGYAVIAPTYRLAPQDPYPAPIEDVFCALAWAYANAESYRMDMTQLVLIGESAGANATALLGTVDDPERFLQDCPYSLENVAEPLGVVAYYMPVDLSSCTCFAAKQMAALYLGVEAEAFDDSDAMRDRWADASPLAWLDAEDPPFLLIHGTRDTLIAMSESYLMMDALAAADLPARLYEIEGGVHGFFDRLMTVPGQEALALVEAQLSEWLAEARSE